MNELTDSNNMKHRPCSKCGLIQLYDELFGLVICDAKEAHFYGCPTKEEVLKKFPSAKYDDSASCTQRKWIVVKDHPSKGGEVEINSMQQDVADYLYADGQELFVFDKESDAIKKYNELIKSDYDNNQT